MTECMARISTHLDSCSAMSLAGMVNLTALIMIMVLSGMTMKAGGDEYSLSLDAPDHSLQSLHLRLDAGLMEYPLIELWPADGSAGEAGSSTVTLQDVYQLLPRLHDEAARSGGDIVPGFRYWGLANHEWGNQNGVASLPEALDESVLKEIYVSEDLDLRDAVDTLRGYNILTNHTLFNVQGTGQILTGFPARVARTGAINSIDTFDDGHYQAGVPDPLPRFVVMEGAAFTNCVLDRLTGLVWMRAVTEVMTVTSAMDYCAELAGDGGRGGFSDWRLPTIRELESLAVYGQPADVPFVGPQDGIFHGFLFRCWSSSAYAVTMDRYWVLDLTERRVRDWPISQAAQVWPVRGPLMID